jgi:hypothetical protein
MLSNEERKFPLLYLSQLSLCLRVISKYCVYTVIKISEVTESDSGSVIEPVVPHF